MRRLIKFLPASLLGMLITGCQGDVMTNYVAQAMPGLSSPFTSHCTTIKIQIGNVFGTLSLDSGAQSGSLFTSTPPASRTISAQCYAIVNGTLTQLGSSQLSYGATVTTVQIGSGEGSSAAASFTNSTTTSGYFPIIIAQ